VPVRRSDDDVPLAEPERLPEPEMDELLPDELFWLDEPGVELDDVAEAEPDVEAPGAPRLLLDWLLWPWIEVELLSIVPDVLKLRLESALPETLELPERLMSVETELLLGLSRVPLAEIDELDELLGVVDPGLLVLL
jgi:hypothetical protein